MDFSFHGGAYFTRVEFKAPGCLQLVVGFCGLDDRGQQLEEFFGLLDHVILLDIPRFFQQP